MLQLCIIIYLLNRKAINGETWASMIGKSYIYIFNL